ncbi:MAG TPA: biotin/lipoyl-containing protein [Candidatus Thalassarchaeaceae archaeon]|nr:biotin/lipoyl-containing protein [Candidatus Thalassarchaeaceae archaeon]
MKDFINHQDGSKWTVAAVTSKDGYAALRVMVDDEAIDVGDWHLSTTKVREEITLERDGNRENIVLTKVGDVWWVHHNGHTSRISVVELGAQSTFDQMGGLTSPMPGKILTVMASIGESVNEGQTLLILEAMKMENRICSPVDGVVTAIHFEAGTQVNQGAVLIEIEEA